VFATQIMNEGWASYWHARLLREADFLPQSAYVDAIKCHSDVVKPYAADQQIALQVNPYHLGFTMWEKIIERDGIEAARNIMQQDDDFSFVRNYLDDKLADELQLFKFNAEATGKVEVVESKLSDLHEAMLAPKYNFGAPSIAASHVHVDGSLELQHDYKSDGRGLDPDRATKVLDYIYRVWRRPIVLHTIDDNGAAMDIRKQ
jgi:stage V sporulation protein R